MELPNPYRFVRFITITLGLLWTLAAAVRLVRMSRRWETRMNRYGVPRGWFRRQILMIVARTTVLDPVNLGLLCILVGIWTLGWIVRSG